jgi:hypothetical protein
MASMNAALHPEVLLLRRDDQQGELPFDTEGVLRYVWEGRYGSILIEVIEQQVYVNGRLVEHGYPRRSDAARP